MLELKRNASSDCALEALRSRVSTKDIFRKCFPGHYRESGNSLCPFHEDRQPSFQVDDEMAFCHAGCGKKDAIDIFMHANGIPFREAVCQLKAEYGIPEEKTYQSGSKSPLEDAFHHRGISLTTLKMALPRVSCLPKTEKYNPAIAFQLSDFSGDEKIGTQIIPIAGGDKKFSQGTPAKRAFFRLPGSGPVVVTEGIWDALSVKDVMPDADSVSILGASFAGKLSFLPKDLSIVLFLDNDEAGAKATDRAAKVLNNQCKIVDWSLAPKGMKDPNDILKAGDGNVIKAMIEGAVAPEVHAPVVSANDDGEVKTKQADILIAMGRKLGTFFHDPEGKSYLRTSSADRQEVHAVRSRDFKDMLRRKFYLTLDSSPSAQALQDALDTLDAIARLDSPQEKVFIRIAHTGGKVYLDLADKDWRVVEITPGSWRVLKQSPVNFRRTKGMLPLPLPTPGGSIDCLRPHLNLPSGSDGDESWRLIVGWLVGCFSTGPYPLLVFQAEQGSGKSFMATTLKDFIDPAIAPIRTPPREERDLVIACVHGHVIAYDNLSGVPGWLSDALCRVATGAGFAARKYYTDDEETIFQYRRPLILNGIDQVTSRHDLADRSITVELPPISKEERKDEEAILAQIERIRPQVLGALCTVVSEALKKEAPKPTSLPRMADFALWVHHAESALGWEPSSFLRTYDNNRKEGIEASVDADAFAIAIKELMQAHGEFAGTASELLEKLNGQVSDATQKLKAWPKAPNVASNRLRRAAPFLREVGIQVMNYHKGKNKTKIIHLEREGKRPTGSAESFLSDENHYNSATCEMVESSGCQSVIGRHNGKTVPKPNGGNGAGDASHIGVGAENHIDRHMTLKSLKVVDGDDAGDEISQNSIWDGDKEVF